MAFVAHRCNPVIPESRITCVEWMMHHDRTVLLFRNDLRLDDNPGFAAHAAADELVCVYCWTSASAWCNLNGLGAQRETLPAGEFASVKMSWWAMGQGLLVLRTDPRAHSWLRGCPFPGWGAARYLATQ